ncbi:MAG: acyl-CoA dehydrogenase family protein, partial [Deltaproteobacteria bacterium]
MAEQAQDLPTPEVPERGGSFLFEPVGARPFMTPEKFSADQRQFFRTGAEFTRAEVIEERQRFDDHDYGMLRELIGKAGELGLLGVDIPEEYGGLGLDKVTS